MKKTASRVILGQIDARLSEDTPSLRQIARELGIDPAHVSRVMSGQRVPSLKLTVRLANLLGVGLERFTTYLARKAKSRVVAGAEAKETRETKEART